MIRISVLAVALVAAAAIPMQAQQRGGGNMEQRLERMQSLVDSAVTHLGLEGEVEEEFREVMAADIEQRRELFESLRGNRQAMAGMREGMQELDEETDERLASILTDEQLATFSEMRRGRQGGRAGRRGGRPR